MGVTIDYIEDKFSKNKNNSAEIIQDQARKKKIMRNV